MKRLTLTITRYDKPEADTIEMSTVRNYRPNYDDIRQTGAPEPFARENVLVLDITEDQYAAIKKAALETF